MFYKVKCSVSFSRRIVSQVEEQIKKNTHTHATLKTFTESFNIAKKRQNELKKIKFLNNNLNNIELQKNISEEKTNSNLDVILISVICYDG